MIDSLGRPRWAELRAAPRSGGQSAWKLGAGKFPRHERLAGRIGLIDEPRSSTLVDKHPYSSCFDWKSRGLSEHQQVWARVNAGFV